LDLRIGESVYTRLWSLFNPQSKFQNPKSRSLHHSSKISSANPAGQGGFAAKDKKTILKDLICDYVHPVQNADQC
jgi:hypothetical protein